MFIYIDIKFRSPLQKPSLAWQVLCITDIFGNLYLFIQTWDLLLIMYHGFNGLCNEFLTKYPGCFIAPIHVNGSAIESIFSSLKYILGANLSSTNYATSLSSLITQKDIHQQNPHAEKGYRTDIGKLN